MGLRAKSRTRLVVLTVAALGTAAVFGGGYAALKYHRIQQIKQGKPKGLAAYAADEWVAALHYLGPYLQRYGDDVEALAPYAKVREQLPEPGGRNLYDAMGRYRRLVALQPANLAYKRSLAKLYAMLGMNTETIQGADDVIDYVAGELGRAYPTEAQAAARARPQGQAVTGPAEAEGATGPKVRTAQGILVALRAEMKETPEIRTQYVEPLAEALKLKVWGMLHMRKMGDAKALVGLLEQVDPGAASAATELEYMRANFETKTAIIARMEELTAAMADDPDAWTVKARTYSICDAPEKARAAARTAAEARFRQQLGKNAGTVLSLVEILDELELFTDASEVLESARQAHPGEALDDEHFRRMIYREKYAAAAEELAKVDVTRRPLEAGLRIVALCSWGNDLEAAGNSAEAATKKAEAQRLLKVLEECNGRWDFRAKGWLDVLQLVYFTKKPADRLVIDTCQEAVSRDPGNPFFCMYLGNAYQASGDATAALPQWDRARQLAPSWSRPLSRLSRYFAATGRPADAYWQAVAADARMPDQKETLEAMAVSWRGALGQPGIKSAAELLAFIAAHKGMLGMDEAVLPLEVDLLAGQQANPDKAAARIREAVASATKDNSHVLLMVAMIAHQGKLGEAVEKECLDTFEKLNGITPDLAAVKCRILLEDKAAAPQVKAAFEGLRKQAAAEVSRVEWDIAWCQLLEVIKDAGAHDAWKALAAAHPDSTPVQWSALAANSVRGDHALTGLVLEQLKKLNGDTGLTWRTEEGRWLLEDSSRDSLEQAVKLMAQTVAAAPQSLEARKILAQAYVSMENIGAAVAELVRAADDWPDDLDLKLALATLYQRQNDPVREGEQLKRVASAAYGTDAQKTRAGVMLAQLGETDLATNLLEKNGQNSDQADFMLTLLYWKKGDLPRARSGFLKMLGLEDKDGKIVPVAGVAPTGEGVEQALGFFSANGMKAEGDATLDLMDKMTAMADPIKHAIRGTYLSQIRDYDRAIVEFKAALEGDPKNGAIWRRLLVTQLNAAKIDDSVATAQSTEAKAAMPADGGRLALEKLGAGAGAAILQDSDVRGYLVGCLTNPAQARGLADVVSTLQTNSGDRRKLGEGLHLAADRNPEALGLQVLAARKLMEAGMMDDALAVARRAMLNDATAVQPALLTALCLADMGRWEETLAAARKWKALTPGSLDADMLIAATYLRLAQPAEAIKALGPYVDKMVKDKTAANPENRPVVYMFATALMQGGQAEQARTLIWPLVENDQSWREDWTRLATDNLKKADQAVAESWLKMLGAKTADSDIEGRMILAVAWGRLGKNFSSDDAKQEAYRMSIAAVDMQSADPLMRAKAAVVAGGMLDQINDLTHAEELYRKSLALNPRMHPAANNLALVLVKAYRLDDAEVFARQAIGLSPEIATYYDTLAAVLKAKKKWDDALATIDMAIVREPRNPEWLISKGEIQAAAAAAGKKPDVSAVRGRIEQLHFDFARTPELKARYDGLPK